MDRTAPRRASGGCLSLPGVWPGAVPVGDEIRVALWLAVLLRRARTRRGPADRGPLTRHAPHRGPVRGLRLALGSPLRRRTTNPDRRPLLHELDRPHVRADRPNLGIARPDWGG